MYIYIGHLGGSLVSASAVLLLFIILLTLILIIIIMYTIKISETTMKISILMILIILLLMKIPLLLRGTSHYLSGFATAQSQPTSRKGTDGVSTNGVSANVVLFDRGSFWVLPLICFYIPKSARAYLFPQSVSFYYFCSGPISVDPICSQPRFRNRAVATHIARCVNPTCCYCY